MIKYAFDARSSKIILEGEEGDVYVDINNILAMEDSKEGYTTIWLATGGENIEVCVKDKVADVVAFIKKLADEQMTFRDAEAKAREEAYKAELKAREDAKCAEGKAAE